MLMTLIPGDQIGRIYTTGVKFAFQEEVMDRTATMRCNVLLYACMAGAWSGIELVAKVNTQPSSMP